MLAIRVFPAVAAIAALCFPRALYAQFTDARTYTEGPVGLNSLEFNYAYVRANASIDTSLPYASQTPTPRSALASAARSCLSSCPREA